MKILAIGNSFSQDATYYLHQIAKEDNVDLKVVNLYIGGCNLETHWENLCYEKKLYLYELNGQSLDKYVSIQDVMDEEKWDVIITQQASHDSGWIDTYEPFLTFICDYLKEKQPQAKLYLHQTWAYEIDSTHNGFWRYHKNQDEMYKRLTYAYYKCAKEHDLSIIPSGDVIQMVRKHPLFDYQNGGASLCRDGFHMDFMYGRYLLSAVWYCFLCDKPIVNNKYIPKSQYLVDNICCESKLKVIKEIVNDMYLKSRNGR